MGGGGSGYFKIEKHAKKPSTERVNIEEGLGGLSYPK